MFLDATRLRSFTRYRRALSVFQGFVTRTHFFLGGMASALGRVGGFEMARWILIAGAVGLLGNELYSIATGVLQGPGAGTIAAAFFLASAAAVQAEHVKKKRGRQSESHAAPQ